MTSPGATQTGRLISPSFNYLLWSPGGRSKGLSVNERGIDRKERQGICSPAPPHSTRRHTICLPVLAASQQTVRRSDSLCLWTLSKNQAATWHRTSVQTANANKTGALRQTCRFLAQRGEFLCKNLCQWAEINISKTQHVRLFI